MTIRFTCSECGSVLKIKDELSGTSARCPKCKTKFVVPPVSSDEPVPGGESEEIQTHDSKSEPPLSDEHSRPDIDSTPNESAVAETPSKSAAHPESPSVTLQNSESSDAGSRPEELARVRPSSKLTAEFSESPTVATGSHPIPAGDEAPLSLDDSDSNVIPLRNEPNENGNGAASISSITSEDDDDHEEDLDSPSAFVSSVMTPKPHVESSGKKSEKRRTSSEMPVKEPKSDSSKHDEPFDPMKYLTPDAPAKPRITFPDEPNDDSDLSLSDDSIDEPVGRPTPQPMDRHTPAAMNTRTTPEKVDLATAARMMKKAIKESQAEAAHQRELEASAGFDYLLFFREFGVRGVAVLVGGIVLFIGCLLLGNYAFGSKMKLPKMGYVRGTVTLDGQPLAGAIVQYDPLEIITMEGGKRDRARASIGVTDEKGRFKMMYRPTEGIEGVAVGKCRVWVSHLGPNGEDVPPEWLQSAMVIREVTLGNQKAPADISMEPKKAPKKK